MARMKFAAAAVMLALVSGCAAGVSAREEPKSEAVLLYTPPSLQERIAQWRLFAQEAKARKRIAAADAAAREAIEHYIAAAKLFYAGMVPPEMVRPTREELEALEAEADAKWVKYTDEVIKQVDLYEEFLARYPHNWYARHRYAWFLTDHNFRYEAAEEWRKVIELEPRFPYAYNNLASLYNHMGRDMEAVDLYLKAIALKEDDPTFHVNLAVNYSTHRYDVAKKFGWDLPRVFGECIAEYRRARELAPNDVDIARELAGQYVLAKYFKVTDTADEAIEAWKYYLSLDLTRIQRGIGCRNIGRIYLTQKNDPAEAVEWLERSYELLGDPGSKTLLERARKAMNSGRAPNPQGKNPRTD